MLPQARVQFNWGRARFFCAGIPLNVEWAYPLTLLPTADRLLPTFYIAFRENAWDVKQVRMS
jgi:hypothetical protein